MNESNAKGELCPAAVLFQCFRLLFPFSRSFEKKTVSCGFCSVGSSDVF